MITFVDMACLANLGCKYALAVNRSAALRMMLNMAQMMGSWAVGSKKLLFVAPIFRTRARSWKCCERERKEENENWIGNQI